MNPPQEPLKELKQEGSLALAGLKHDLENLRTSLQNKYDPNASQELSDSDANQELSDSDQSLVRYVRPIIKSLSDSITQIDRRLKNAPRNFRKH
jgi:small-conductance mechanosensitive channel